MCASMVAVTADANLVAELGRALADAVVAALPAWVASSVERVARAAGVAVGPDADAVRAAAAAALAEVEPRLRALLAADIDDQRDTPLNVVRATVGFPTAVLRAAGVPPVVRDRFHVERFPDDVYGLVPAAFADLGDAVHEAGIRWGAAKAIAHQRRHR